MILFETRIRTQNNISLDPVQVNEVVVLPPLGEQYTHLGHLHYFI